MEVSVSVEINKPVKDVWDTISDIENCPKVISSIVDLQVLENPADTFVGFKWTETRVMFGKEASETMWITDYKDQEFYQTRAESHGSIYISKLSVEPSSSGSQLTMSFKGEAQSTFSKIFSFCLGFLFIGGMKKALLKDLNDIKNHLEK